MVGGQISTMSKNFRGAREKKGFLEWVLRNPKTAKRIKRWQKRRYRMATTRQAFKDQTG